MSLAILRSRTLAGMGAPAVSVEGHLANGPRLAAFHIGIAYLLRERCHSSL
jgi:hypothetical protein